MAIDKGVNKILVINLGGVGDILLSTPALRALKAHHPESRVFILTTAKASEIISSSPDIDGFYVLEFKLSTFGVFKNLNTLLYLKKMNFDLAINMRSIASRRGAVGIRLLLAIINPKVKAGRNTEGRGGFFDIKINETDPGDKPEMLYDIDLIEALGGKVIDRSIGLKVEEGDFKKIEKMLENEGICRDDLVLGIHPGGRPSSRWGIGNFAELIRKINNNIHCKFVITGSKEESCLARDLAKKPGIKIIDMSGRLSIKELAALIKRCDLYICNDTGPMHIAAALRIPLVAIFGPGFLKRFDPRNIYQEAIVIYKEAHCAPCNKFSCQSKECLKMISPDEVAEAALRLLDKKRREG